MKKGSHEICEIHGTDQALQAVESHHWIRGCTLLSCVLCLSWFSALAASGCELCAVYGAENARGGTGRGWLFTIAEQYISAHTLNYEGEETSAATDPFFKKAFVDSSFTHFVPGYNFSSRFGLSLNVPLIHREFTRTTIATVF